MAWTKRTLEFLSLLLASLLLMGLSGPAWAQQQAAKHDSYVIVLDVSNSMWGQVEGRSKIEIAREVIGGLIKDWDPARPLGLVAYGHRRAGDCSDIETVLPVGPVDPVRFQAIVNGLTPRGKTPLTAAVKQAAEILNYADVPATVILVSDGIESCKADPCLLAATLEKGGVDFTAHVIGFDIDKVQDKSQLKCLADLTGGKFLTAKTSKELAVALKEVAKAPPPTEALVTLEAVEKAGGPALAQPGLTWNLIALDTEDNVLTDHRAAKPQVKLKPGNYLARAQLGKASGQVQFTITDLKASTRQVVLQIAVSLQAPKQAEIGSEVPVQWQAPGAGADYLALSVPGAPAASYITYARLSGGSPTKLKAPREAGEYEIRYVDGAKSKILATVKIAIVDLSAKLTAPPTVEIGATFKVGWEGPGGKGDYVAIAEAKAPAGKNVGYARTRDGNPLELRAPDLPGTYELRYIAGLGHKIAGKATIEVTDVKATLEAPPVANAGSEIEVTWSGPDRQGDFVAVVKAGAKEGSHIKYFYTRTGSPGKLTMPIDPGSYEIRYVTAKAARTLARLPVQVQAVPVKLEAPPVAAVGSEIEVAWAGPDGNGDFVTVVKAGAAAGKYGKYFYTRTGSPGKLVLPIEPGDYEIRYIAKQGNKTLGSIPIKLTGVQVTLEVPPVAPVGSEIEVAWRGPDSQGDFVTVVKAGEKAGKYGKYFYTRTGSPGKLVMPIEPGDYEIRYIAKQGHKTLGSVPIKLTDVQVTLEVPPTAGVGSTIAVAWKGPDSQGDFVTVVKAGEKAGKYGKYFYTRTGSPGKLIMPIEPGDYEIRYIAKQGNKTLASVPIKLTAVQVSLDAPPTAGVGSTIAVAWTGPDSQGDFVTVVEAGEKAGKYGKYFYTRTGSPGKLLMPIEPGDYEIRYIARQGHKTLGSVPIKLTAVEVSLAAPPTAGAGSRIDVTWAGPDSQNDYVAVVRKGDAKNKAINYFYTRTGSPGKLLMPDQAGDYEIRYIANQGKKPLASIPISIQAATASLTAPPTAGAGSRIDVAWSGPGNERDYVAIAAAGSPDKKQLGYFYTRSGSPGKLLMPDQPGTYELRYVMGKSRMVLTRLPINITEVSATLTAPPSAGVNSIVEIAWTGPGNERDLITIAPAGSPNTKLGSTARPKAQGPVRLSMPAAPGNYELRYLLGKSRRVLARLPIVVN